MCAKGACVPVACWAPARVLLILMKFYKKRQIVIMSIVIPPIVVIEAIMTSSIFFRGLSQWLQTLACSFLFNPL